MRPLLTVIGAVLICKAIEYAYHLGRYHERYYGEKTAWGIMHRKEDGWS